MSPDDTDFPDLDPALPAELEINFEDEEGDEATEWHSLPPEREFVATPYDPPIKTLVQEIREKDLIVRPTFQRFAVWDKTRKSRFIESVLLNIPIPNLFFAEDEDQTKVVVDGQQRLLAVKEFVENQFALQGIEVLTPLKGKRFDDLTERQRKIIRNRTLRCLVISSKSDPELRFQVFERLNQGGVPLNAQEVRHCVYRGKLNDLLHELAKDPVWLEVFGASQPSLRMTDCELILRFFALRDVLPKYTPPLKKLLNDFMRNNRNPDEATIASLRDAFQSALRAVSNSFGTLAFRRILKAQPGQEARLDRNANRAVFDVQMLLMEGLDPTWARDHQAKILSEFAKLSVTDQVFIDAVSRATADRTRLASRLRRWSEALAAIGAPVTTAVRVPQLNQP